MRDAILREEEEEEEEEKGLPNVIDVTDEEFTRSMIRRLATDIRRAIIGA